jgi:cysteine desulfurase
MIYLDNAASTRPAPEVLDAMAAAARDLFANPSSAHALGAAAARAIEDARARVAQALGAVTSAEIIFTSGGTEADALGLLGAAARARGRHLVVSALEHPAVLRSAEMLVADGYELTVVVPDPSGVVRAEDVVAAVRPDTAVVAVMLVNNELGTIQPVAEIARGLAHIAPDHPHRPHLHVDGVQAFGFLPLRVSSLGADSLAISGHKFHGPKGTGALWLRSGARLAPLWDGGRQERGLRSGTENLPGWVGLGVAAALVVEHRDAHAADRIRGERDRLERLVLALPVTAANADARPTVSGAPRAPHISSLSFPGLPAEPLLHALEARGVYASAGSACASRARGPNHVLQAIAADESAAVLRFSLSRDTTADDVDGAVAALRDALEELAPMAKTGARR